MKVLDLRCAQQHAFEGWFGSEDDFQGQLARGLLECPLCGERQVEKQLSAPRLNLGAARSEATESAVTPAGPAQRQQAWLAMVREVMARTEDVGPRFAEEARKIHYGESEERGIRGQASPEQRRELADEGIEVMSLPVPAALKQPVH